MPSITPTQPTRAGWTGCGACTSGSTGRHEGVTRRDSGSAATTSTTSAELRRGCRWRNRGPELNVHVSAESLVIGLPAACDAGYHFQTGVKVTCMVSNEKRVPND